MSQIEKINRERDSRTSTPSSSGKKHGNGVVSRPANPGNNLFIYGILRRNLLLDSKYILNDL